MNLREFAKGLTSITPAIHIALIRHRSGVLTKGELAFPQMVILNVLSMKKECRMGEISKILRVTKGAATGLVDRLVKAHLLTRVRTEKDRRVVKITPTPKGLAISRKIRNHMCKMIEYLFSNVTSAERTQYLNILRKLRQNVKVKI